MSFSGRFSGFNTRVTLVPKLQWDEPRSFDGIKKTYFQGGSSMTFVSSKRLIW